MQFCLNNEQYVPALPQAPDSQAGRQLNRQTHLPGLGFCSSSLAACQQIQQGFLCNCIISQMRFSALLSYPGMDLGR